MKKKDNKKDTWKWFIIICITTFILSIIFSYISTNAITNLSIIPALIILVSVIVIGIVFDIIGVAVTVAKEEEFHAKATKKAVRSKNVFKANKKFCTSCEYLCRCNRRYLSEYLVER